MCVCVCHQASPSPVLPWVSFHQYIVPTTGVICCVCVCVCVCVTRLVPPQSCLGCLFINTFFQLACPEESFSSNILGSAALRANTGMERVNSPLYLIKLLLFTSQTPQRSVPYSKKAALTLDSQIQDGGSPFSVSQSLHFYGAVYSAH